MTSDQVAKLNEILEKLGIGSLKEGEDKSEKLRLFIDKLHSLYAQKVTTNLPEVSEDWFCLKGEPRHPNPQMQVAKCDVCRAHDWNRWHECQDYKRGKHTK